MSDIENVRRCFSHKSRRKRKKTWEIQITKNYKKINAYVKEKIPWERYYKEDTYRERERYTNEKW